MGEERLVFLAQKEVDGAVREGGRRREVGWWAYKKVGSRGELAPALLPTPLRKPKAFLFLLLDDQVDQEEDDDGADSAGQDRSDPAFAEGGAEDFR